MKRLVQLAVLLATLLLLTGVAFAPPMCWPFCYEMTATDLDDPTNTHTGCIRLDLCENNTGFINGPFGTNMSLFFDSMRKQALGYDDSDPSCVGYFKFHGDDLYVITGIGFCEGERHQIRGHQSACCAIYSDETLKKNIEPLSSSLEKVMLLQGVSYDWKADDYPEMGFTKDRQIGFIAQDVEKVFPELVKTNNNGYKGVYYVKIVPILLEAMKEQQKEISELKKQQAMFAELTEKIAQLEKALEKKGNKVSAE